jgi:undecaprenyl-diphosphatase
VTQVTEPRRAARGTRDRKARLVLAGAALAAVAVPFVLLLVLVEDKWEPLAEADRSARDNLHQFALDHSAFVTVMRLISNSGSSLAWQVVLGVVALWLVWRRLWRLAAFVVLTGIGSSLLNTAVKAAVNRPRPLVDHPLVHLPGASFPSGHAQSAMTGYSVLLLVFLPVVPPRWRRPLVAAAAFMVLAICFSRVALAAHYVSDVVAGVVLGGAWTAAMAAVFSAWRLERGRPAGNLVGGLAPEQAQQLDPTHNPTEPGSPHQE